MQPPPGSVDSVLQSPDAVDIAVLVRSGPQRWPTPHWHWAKTPWPAVGMVPPNGWYLVTTTWREIVKHATEVGRDVAPWLRNVPQLAGQELLARISPLYAYLSIEEKHHVPHPHSAGRRLMASVVHEHGTEVTARGAFAYRLGMTMAQWACCGLPSRTEGCGPTSAGVTATSWPPTCRTGLAYTS
jgi:hypothetical protein